jgi:cytosine/adenosine deaminase-related metal-dependent hydrolase
MGNVDSYALTGATVVTPRGIRTGASLLVEGAVIGGFGRTVGRQASPGKRSFVYPALINVHDHLRGNYLPRIGPKGDAFYVNWAPWDNDLKSSATYQERANISIEQMYFLGAYKNLFSGVGTVNDHFPHEFNEPYIDRLPIRVIREYTLAHECSSYDLKWGEGIEIEHSRAVERNWPFITHLEEGFDLESQDGVGVLERAGALDDKAVLIHCIGFSEDDLRKVKKAGASVAWCPASNTFMFNVTCKIRKLLRLGVNVALGTDSTHTGSPNLLAEMKYARKVYREMYGEELPAKTLFDMVTVNAASAFRLGGKVGALEPGHKADIAIFAAKAEDPYESLLLAEPGDLELLVLDGKPVFGDEARFGELFAAESTGMQRIEVGGRRCFVRGDPAGLYRDVRGAVGFAKKLDYLPFEP